MDRYWRVCRWERTSASRRVTERAFLNDKIDLAQAEAVADLIDSVVKPPRVQQSDLSLAIFLRV